MARFNDLNQDDDLDIECIKFTPTGTRFSYRYCLTTLQRRAQQKDANDFMNFMHDSDVQNGAQTPARGTAVELMARWGEYRGNLARLLQDYPDLRELVMQSSEALRRYEAARRRGKAPAVHQEDDPHASR